jgi:uncharacterized membrane protein required for colicin V production
MGRTISVNWIDWITLAIVLVSVLRGTRYGVLAGVIDLVAMVGAFFAATVTYARIVPVLHRTLFLPEAWGGFLAFVVIWLGLYILVGIIVRLAHGVRTLPLSEILGGVMGVVRGIAMAAALLVVILASPFREAVEPDTRHSTVAPLLLRGYNAFMVNIASTLPVRIPRFGQPDGIMF